MKCPSTDYRCILASSSHLLQPTDNLVLASCDSSRLGGEYHYLQLIIVYKQDGDKRDTIGEKVNSREGKGEPLWHIILYVHIQAIRKEHKSSKISIFIDSIVCTYHEKPKEYSKPYSPDLY